MTIFSALRLILALLIIILIFLFFRREKRNYKYRYRNAPKKISKGKNLILIISELFSWLFAVGGAVLILLAAKFFVVVVGIVFLITSAIVYCLTMEEKFNPHFEEF